MASVVIRTAPSDWPATKGTFTVSDPTGPVAVCVLTSDELISATSVIPGVAISGTVQTANVGIEAIVLNTISNRNLRFLVLCGKDSKLFRPGQSLRALHENGVDDGQVIIGAEGHEPTLASLSRTAVDRFREQLNLIDMCGVEDLDEITAAIEQSRADDPGPFAVDFAAEARSAVPQIKPGGSRQPITYDSKGVFVITIEPDAGQIHVLHYGPDRLAAHEMRGRSAESILLGLLRERLVTQLSHAGYLGAELAKAETALRLELPYTQDRPLRQPGVSDLASHERKEPH